MHCLIIDDDPLICDMLAHFCEKVDAISHINTTHSGFESINLINRGTFDLVFLDYDLPDLTGKDILEVLQDRTAVVMITAFTEFAAQSYDYPQVVDYLVKPFEFSRFHQAISRAESYLSNQGAGHDQIFVKDGHRLVKLFFKDICYCKAEANYVALVTVSKKVLTLMTLKELEGRLPGYFQRVHRSYIVNLHHVDVIDPDGLCIGDVEIPVSTTYQQELMQKINRLN